MASTAPVSLWDRAVNSLTDEDKQSIDFSRTDKPSILTDVLQAAESKKQLCMQKRWKYKKKNGDVIIIRDLCEKAIKWVHKFKEIGDIAVQYDPSYASLPWAAIRFFLQLSVNDVQIFGAMVDGLETIASEITRCRLYEIYSSASSFARADLESHLLRHYTSILAYLATAKRYYTKSTFRRLGESVFETSDSVDACLSKIAAQRDQVERCVRHIDSELLRAIDGTTRGINSTVNKTQTSVDALAGDLKSLTTTMSIAQDVQFQSLKAMLASFDQPILRTAAQVSEIHANLEKTERLSILRWLSTINYREHHKTSLSTVMQGSGAWLQRKKEFIDWKTSSTSSILWIHGIPGSGKSKLVSTVIQNLLDAKSQNTATSAFAYFYCTRDEAEKARADPDEIVRAILKQLSCFDASQPIHAAVLRELKKRQQDADEDGLDPSRFSLQECIDLVLEIADQLPIVVMVDALDECDPLKRHGLLHALRYIVQNSNSLVKVIVSSRDDSDIVCRLNHVPNVYISSDDNGDDVDRYVEQELDKAIDEQRLLQGRVSTSLRQRILDELRSRTHGMFLWARLQIQNLCDPERMIVASDVEAALHHLPATLYELYRGILDRIDRIAPRGQILATKTLTWLLCARMPLTPDLLVEMLQSSEGDSPLLVQEILNLCCNLVVFDDSLDVFRFGHASVREFLELQPRFSFQNVHLYATQECVRLALRSFHALNTSHTSFRDYARRFWTTHYVALDDQFRRAQPLANEVKDFFIRGMPPSKAFDMCESTIVLSEDPLVEIPGSIGNRCTRALTEAVEAIFECQIVDVNLQDFIETTCRYLAARNLHKAVLKDLSRPDACANVSTMLREAVLDPVAEDRGEKIAMGMMQQGANIITPLTYVKSCLFAGFHKKVILERLVSNGVQSEAARKYSLYLDNSVSRASLETWRSDVLGALLVDRITPKCETGLSRTLWILGSGYYPQTARSYNE
ncbi:MAG: hypothetical protein Q9226_001628 [Calogaya cf. arnoldii]